MMGSLKRFIQLTEHSSEIWAVKDTSSHYLYANRTFRQQTGLPLDFDVEGLLDGEIPAAPMCECEEEFQAIDRLVETTKKARRTLEIRPVRTERVLIPLYCEKFPLLNENNEVIGIIFHVCLALNLQFNRDGINVGAFIFDPPNDTLSKKEWDFIYFVTRGYSIKEIARFEKVAPTTISSRQNSVFNKLGINTLAQLKQMAMTNGWVNYIPIDPPGSICIELC